ncbi:MAG: endonuclease [Deltaproteobacteria bacterium]|nr:endonuclease [Deltaproteobacteria bacterium]
MVSSLVVVTGCRLERPLRVEEAQASAAPARSSPRALTESPASRAVERPPRPLDFRAAKQHLRAFYAERGATTLYSSCPLVGGEVDFTRCCVARQHAKRPAVEWEHVVPAATFGGALPEWRDGHPRCQKRDKPFRGRKCARRVSRLFQALEGDLHNLFPEVGDVNGARGDTPMGLVVETSVRHRELPSCGLRFGKGVVEPRGEVHGDVARAYLYMSGAYPEAVVLTEELRALFERWHAEDPPDELERARNRMIRDAQGNDNPWIE